MENYVPSDFDKSILDVMIEAGAGQFWIALCVGLCLIMLFAMLLDSKKYGHKIQKYIDETCEEFESLFKKKRKVVKIKPLNKKGGK